MEIYQMAILFVIIYIAIFTLVNRICKSCEMCAMYKAFGKHIDVSKVENMMKQESK